MHLPQKIFLFILSLPFSQIAYPYETNTSKKMDMHKIDENKAHSYKALVNSELAKVAIDEKVGQTLNLTNLVFFNHNATPVPLAQLLQNGKPTIISFAYYSCPTLCQFVLDGKRKALMEIKEFFNTNDFNLVTISFDAKDNQKTASALRQRQVDALNENGLQYDWHFLYGNSPNIQNITSQFGFSFNWIPATKEFAHPAAIYVLSPKGKLSRYFYGIQFDSFDLKMAVVEAKREETRSTMEKILIYCYQYDSNSRGYSLIARNVMKIAGLLTIVIIAAFLTVMVRLERKKNLLAAQADSENPKIDHLS